jgi:hypothetical protein
MAAVLRILPNTLWARSILTGIQATVPTSRTGFLLISQEFCGQIVYP